MDLCLHLSSRGVEAFNNDLFGNIAASGEGECPLKALASLYENICAMSDIDVVTIPKKLNPLLELFTTLSTHRGHAFNYYSPLQVSLWTVFIIKSCISRSSDEQLREVITDLTTDEDRLGDMLQKFQSAHAAKGLSDHA
jgi:hypothetical protein